MTLVLGAFPVIPLFSRQPTHGVATFSTAKPILPEVILKLLPILAITNNIDARVFNKSYWKQHEHVTHGGLGNDSIIQVKFIRFAGTAPANPLHLPVKR
jgi:hypothetical protein